MLGDERAIVDDTPGTTRDPINTFLSYDGHDYCFVDTAGIRKRGQIKDSIEVFSVMKSLKVLDDSDLALLLIDGIEGVTEQDIHVAGEALKRFKAMIILVNKWDVGRSQSSKENFKKELERKFNLSSQLVTLFLSAKTGMGVDKIFPAVESVRAEYEKRPIENHLHEIFKQLVASHALPTFRGRNVECSGIKQVAIKPPTFLIRCNFPEKVHFSYQRYLTNGLRKHFGFNSVPVKLIFKKS